MPHTEEHPLSSYHVVVDERLGTTVFVLDWLDRMPELARLLTSDTSAGMAYRARTRGRDLDDADIVVVGDGRGRGLVHHDELPAYEPDPVGTVS